MPRLNTVQVCVDLEQFDEPAPMGRLNRQASGAGEIFSFAYSPAWLRLPEAFAFDPDLALVASPQYPAPDRSSFGIFMDSSPDRWGRVLMQRRENMHARREQRRPRTLTQWDFLLGVHDETRLGALRSREGPGQPYVDGDENLAAPPIASLGELQAASLGFEQHLDDENHPSYARWLTQRTDGEAGASYLELVDLLQSRGADTRADCEQLFRRGLLGILIHNTDDHLRNHGFFIDRQGIRLSPAYDIDPCVERRDLSLAVNEVETACDVSIAMDACRDYGLSPTQRAPFSSRCGRP